MYKWLRPEGSTRCQRPINTRAPKDHTSKRILHFGCEALHEMDSRNNGL